MPERTPLAALDLETLASWMTDWDEPAYRAEQVFRAVHAEGLLDAEAITTLPAALRECVAARSGPPATQVVQSQTSADGTTKLLLALADRRRIETVCIPDGPRRTVCVSTQVGCPIRCVFCASGVGGLVRNATVAEITEQVLHVRRATGKRPSHVVVMGMGEPLLNLAHLARAIALWTHPKGLGFSPRRITVSTAGTPSKIDRLADLDLGVHLAVSLHAPDDEVRARLVPGSPAGRTRALVDAAARYARRTRRDATVEYVLIRGENDQPRHAERLAALVRGRHIHVNLIPLNPVAHRPELRAPSGVEARAFARRLEQAGVSVTLRTQRGEDIDAACGQLALERSLVS